MRSYLKKTPHELSYLIVALPLIYNVYSATAYRLFSYQAVPQTPFTIQLCDNSHRTCTQYLIVCWLRPGTFNTLVVNNAITSHQSLHIPEATGLVAIRQFATNRR